MKDDQGLLDKIVELRTLAEEMGMETVVDGMQRVLDSYAEDLRSLDDRKRGPLAGMAARLNIRSFNA